MREISELIYETCKTYLITQGKFIAILEIFIAVDHRAVFRRAQPDSGQADRLTLGDHPALQRRRHSSAATAWRGSASA